MNSSINMYWFVQERGNLTHLISLDTFEEIVINTQGDEIVITKQIIEFLMRRSTAK